ncbi:MAG: ABC transporter substrate-binding protein [Candidatus Polarisedimenticolia bacterium]
MDLTPPRWVAVVVCLVAAIWGCSARDDAREGGVQVRAGHFPNVTHAQALVGRAQGRFQKALEGRAHVSWHVFNAGPSAIEALFAGELDLAYVGPNPAITGYARSRGQALRVVSGACSGGAALVVRADAGIASASDFAGRSLATPQIGNTQDVAARHWLLDNGLSWLEKGGTVRVLPLANSDHLALFLKKELDASWTVEPWVSRLVKEAGGRVFLEESSLWPGGRYVTTHLIAATAFLEKHPDLVRDWIREQIEITAWIQAHPEEAYADINRQLQADTGAALPLPVLQSAFTRLELTEDPLPEALLTAARQAFDLGFLGKSMPDLSGLHDLRPLEEARAAARPEGPAP